MAWMLPHLRVSRIASSSARESPTASMQTSAPRPAVGGAYRRARIAVEQVDRLGSETLGDGEARRNGVNGDYMRSTHRAGRVDSTQPDRTEAEHRHDVAGPQATFGRRVIAGAHHVAREQRDLIAHAGRDPAQDEISRRHERKLRLRTLERAQRLAVPERAREVALVNSPRRQKKHRPQAV